MKILKIVFDWLVFLLTGKGELAEEMVDKGLIDYSGQGRNKYGKWGIMEELWLPIIGYEGLYDVSNLGRIRNSRTNKILRFGKHRQGYKLVLIYNM